MTQTIARELDWIDQAYSDSLNKIHSLHGRIGASFPHVCLEGRYNCENADFWTSGFWGGLLWLAYRETKDEALRETAERIEQQLNVPLQQFYSIHHDVGFMYLPTAVINYRLTGHEESRRTGLIAASHLAGRFNLSGQFIRAWTDRVDPNSTGWAIIDCLMNLPLLFWASKEEGDPRFKHIAVAHADTVLKQFVREDWTVPHIVSFDPETGQKLENLGGQGLGPDSAWSRGQAWAIYGFAIAARETGKSEYLTASKNIANYFLSHLPEDRVPYWDFRTADKDKFARDSTAAACAASGLLELVMLLEDEAEKAFYYESAVAILKGLYDNYADWGDGQDAILTKGTVSYPVNRHVNVPIIYGDYYFVEALVKLKGQQGLF
ncbi:glycoside hydrolase family 88 protein [Paenibacillus sp. J5C_2022]|uniref:glycoside hydrolase family 88 protein n=1 Tax=Paenibacillus sp. J5C2022 TaxID=2977129 RepID=UPI0021CF1DC5|nr:glycoside hydrolase family 88 protein [Paenibacillus sp. J5C2022]MCU6709087.1 glycoside hydrolase family 88 protein [Paenibacillus sp. J5C2022]